MAAPPLRPPRGEVEVVGDVATAFADLVVREQPRTLALSGGGTARDCYEALAARSGLDWSGVQVVFGDDRWVPVDHEDSNEGMARAELLDHVGPGAVHSVWGAGEAIEEAADAYDALVASLGPLDLTHLGLGADGHTASLFPGSPALEVTDRMVVATGEDAHPHPRLTLTFPAIARSRLAVVTVAGEEKAEAWRRVCTTGDVPAARLDAARLLWLVQPEVAGA
jgi:6-phosphogluconolactonase